MATICRLCNKEPIFYKKWKLCKKCYRKSYHAQILQTFPQFTFKSKHRHRRKISDECIHDMVHEGFTTAQIARTCDISRQAVHQRVDKDYKSYNIYHRQYEIVFLYKIGFTQIGISNLLKCNRAIIARTLKKYRIKSPITNEQIIQQNYKEGKTPQQIAKLLKMSISRVYTHLIKHKNYTRAGIRDKYKYKHLFEVNFLKRLGFKESEIKKLTNLSISSISKLTYPKFKYRNSS